MLVTSLCLCVSVNNYPIFKALFVALTIHCLCVYFPTDRDNKSESLSDSREEAEKLRVTIKQLQQEKRELAEDAKSVRVYRDEVEALRVQSAKVEKLEAEVNKYRQKAEDTDYLKKRITVSSYSHMTCAQHSHNAQ